MSNASGNMGATATLNLTVKTTIPAVSTSFKGGTLHQSRPTVTGTAQPGSTVRVSLDGSLARVVTAGPDGTWSFTPPALSVGDHTLAATATDAAGNAGTAPTRGFTVIPPAGSGK